MRRGEQLQVADSFKLEFPAYNSREVNEIGVEESSGDEQEINEISKRKWVSKSNPQGQRRLIVPCTQITDLSIRNSLIIIIGEIHY